MNRPARLRPAPSLRLAGAASALFAALLCGGLAAGAAGAAGPPPEQIVGGIEGVVFVCTPLDAKSVRPGVELLQRAVEQRRLDLVAIRKTEAYRTSYNSEVNRLLSLTPRDRLAACQQAW